MLKKQIYKLGSPQEASQHTSCLILKIQFDMLTRLQSGPGLAGFIFFVGSLHMRGIEAQSSE